MAQEVTQAVFIILARKAGGFPADTPLSGWLYQTARLTTANFLRSEMRRRRREQEAHMETEIRESQTEPIWDGLAPLLDEAMGHLSGKERNAIVSRYFEGRSFSEVALALATNEARFLSGVLGVVTRVGLVRHEVAERRRQHRQCGMRCRPGVRQRSGGELLPVLKLQKKHGVIGEQLHITRGAVAF